MQNDRNDLISRQQAIDALDCISGVEEVLRSLPTIQPEKTQLSQEGTTFDMISRQDALDIFDDYNVSVENGELEAYSRDRKRLLGLPTIQPDVPDINVGDKISRQEALEHFNRTLGATVPITDYDEGFVDGVQFAISTVSTMPTIQPQSTTGQLNDGAQSTDLIDRQQAIDVIEAGRLTKLIDAETAVNGLRELPNSQKKM